MASTHTGIEWTDATWNPMTGCTKISVGCDNCYAHDVAHSARLRDLYRRRLPVCDTPAAQADPFAPRFWPERLDQPVRWKTPKRIFVNSMSDVFHSHFSFGQIEQVFTAMAAAPWHQFQLLTKRPERAARYAQRLKWPEHVWLGVSVETIDVAGRVNSLRKTPAAVKFVSAEPLLGTLDTLNLTDIDWVIGGGESGPQARSCDPVWARGLRDNCAQSGVAFFWKQWGGRTPKSGGRELDGAEYSEYPRELATA
jgi:protein gp37